jgi:hypothetical protein
MKFKKDNVVITKDATDLEHAGPLASKETIRLLQARIRELEGTTPLEVGQKIRDSLGVEYEIVSIAPPNCDCLYPILAIRNRNTCAACIKPFSKEEVMLITI